MQIVVARTRGFRAGAARTGGVSTPVRIVFGAHGGSPVAPLSGGPFVAVAVAGAVAA